MDTQKRVTASWRAGLIQMLSVLLVGQKAKRGHVICPPHHRIISAIAGRAESPYQLTIDRQMAALSICTGLVSTRPSWLDVQSAIKHAWPDSKESRSRKEKTQHWAGAGFFFGTGLT